MIKNTFWMAWILIALPLSLFSSSLRDAQLAYEQGEKSLSYQEREKCFNEALKIYHQHECDYGKVYFNLANCYYQLNQMGMAIYYYYKALDKLPRDQKVKGNFFKVKKAVGLAPSKTSQVISNLFYPHTHLTLGERKVMLACLMMISLAFASWIIWKNSFYGRTLFSLFAILTCLLGISIVKDQYFNSRHGILVIPSQIHCDAGEQYQKISHEIQSEGLRVKIVEFSSDLSWAKIKNSCGEVGYVPMKNLRIL